jgi:ribosome-associated translation inhibitor RaiA
MQIDIHAHGLTLTPELRQHVRHRLALALDRVELRVRHVKVMLSDVNGPRGGVDKCCQLQVELWHLPRLVVLETCDDMTLAIDGAIDRAVHTMGRLIGRQRDALRRGRPERRLAVPATDDAPAVAPALASEGVHGRREGRPHAPGAEGQSVMASAQGHPLPSTPHGGGGQYGREARV